MSSPLQQAHTTLTLHTRGQGLTNFTAQVARWLAEQQVRTGLLTVFVQHTSASLVIQENADPDVLHDLNEFFRRTVRESEPWFRHTTEGPDDMPAHIRAAMTQTSIGIPVRGGRLALGTWQGIYLFEHRAHPHARTIVLHLVGEAA